MRRLAAGVTATLALAVAGVIVASTGAAAQAPAATGWWSFASHEGQQAPPPPDVQPGDLLVQGGDLGGAAPDLGVPTSPTAVAALRFTVPPDATAGALTLTVADGAQAADVRAYPVKKDDWKPAEGGPLSDAPQPDQQRYSGGVLDGTSLVFRDIGRLVSPDGRLSVVLLPGAADRVVVKKPTAAALAVTQSGDDAFAAPPTASGGEAPAPVSGGGGTGAGSAPLLGGSTTGAPPDAGAVAPPALAAAPEPAVASQPPAVAAPASTSAAFDRARVEADQRTRYLVALEALLVLVTFGLLGWGPLARLAVLTGRPPTEASTARGVGRFVRERSGEVVRL